MKKRVSYILLAFIFTVLSLCVCLKVKASSPENMHFWETVENYEVIETDGVGNYEFYPGLYEGEDSAKVYNFDFRYEYTITVDTPISDAGNSIFEFYGSYQPITVHYLDLQRNVFNPINDEFKVYKYNFTSKQFEIIYSPGNNKSGDYDLDLGSTCNLYKLVSEDLAQGDSNPVYVIVDDNITSGSFDTIEINQEEATISASVAFRAPFNYENITHNIKVDTKYEEFTDYITSSEVTTVDAIGKFKLDVVVNLKDKTLTNNKLKVILNEFEVVQEDFSFDFLAPTINSAGKFYNSNLMLKDFAVDVSQRKPDNWAYQFEANDIGGIASVTTNFDSVNCEFISVSTGGFFNATITCVGDSSISTGEESIAIDITVKDYAGNASVETINPVFDKEYVTSSELETLITIEGNVISLSDTTDISKLCIFYGETLNKIYECVDITSTEINSLESKYYYSGPVTIVALDEAKNAALVEKNVIFTKGYDADASKTEIEVLNNERVNQSLETLKTVTGLSSLDEVKKYIKYGELVEEYNPEDTLNLTVLQMLNNKFQDKACAFNKCEKVVEIVINFTVADVLQSASAQYVLKDNIPVITNLISLKDVDLEYADFDIKNVDLKTKLYASGYLVDLVDEEGVKYSGRVTSSFVKLIGNDGVVELLSNEEYDYIASAKKLGVYILECRVKITSRISDNYEYTDYYGKSFFINVNLKDTTLPTVSIVGDANVTLKQHDVYKDSGAKCEDATGCAIEIKYYLDGQSVESIDTSVEGTYTIEYVATDAGGNVAKTTRTIVVENVNVLDTTSIIIIVSVVVLFVIFITTGIIIEKKKSRKTDSREG